MQHNINSRVHAAAHLLRLSNQYGKDAPLAGPDFPAPSKLASSAPLKASIEKFETYLNDEASRLKTEDTAFAVSLFSSREKVTLYENYYTPPVDMGVKEVNRDSVFRVGSISKVVTVWAFLIAAGDEYFHDPVTKHVPELADLTAKRSGASEEPSVVYDDIETARWEDITLGQLASHGAGIARDCKLPVFLATYPGLKTSPYSLVSPCQLRLTGYVDQWFGWTMPASHGRNSKS